MKNGYCAIVNDVVKHNGDRHLCIILPHNRCTSPKQSSKRTESSCAPPMACSTDEMKILEYKCSHIHELECAVQCINACLDLDGFHSGRTEVERDDLPNANANFPFFSLSQFSISQVVELNDAMAINSTSVRLDWHLHISSTEEYIEVGIHFRSFNFEIRFLMKKSGTLISCRDCIFGSAT